MHCIFFLHRIWDVMTLLDAWHSLPGSLKYFVAFRIIYMCVKILSLVSNTSLPWHHHSSRQTIWIIPQTTVNRTLLRYLWLVTQTFETTKGWQIQTDHFPYGLLSFHRYEHLSGLEALKSLRRKHKMALEPGKYLLSTSLKDISSVDKS